MLYVHKYAPCCLNDIEHNRPIVRRLMNMSTSIKTGRSHSLPNMIFKGKPGSGKKTYVRLLLKDIYGDAVLSTKKEIVNDMEVYVSPYHIDIDVSQTNAAVSLYDCILNYIQTINIQTRSYTVVVLSNFSSLADKLQHKLKYMMYKYMNTCRMIWIVSSSNIVLKNVLYCFLVVRCSSPKKDDLKQMLCRIATSEDVFQKKKQEEKEEKEDKEDKEDNNVIEMILEQGQRHITNTLLLLELYNENETTFDIHVKYEKNMIASICKQICHSRKLDSTSLEKLLAVVIVPYSCSQSIGKIVNGVIDLHKDNMTKSQIVRCYEKAALYQMNGSFVGNYVYHLCVFVHVLHRIIWEEQLSI